MVDVFISDNLSDFDDCRLDELTQELSATDVELEKSLRRELHALFQNLRQWRCEFGRLLAEYKRLYKKKRCWGVFCGALGVNIRTAHRLIEDYQRAEGIPESVRRAAADEGIDVAARKNRNLLEIVSREVSGKDLPASEVAPLLNKAKGELKESQSSLRILETPIGRRAEAERAIEAIYRSAPERERSAEIVAFGKALIAHHGKKRTAVHCSQQADEDLLCSPKAA